jgi:hypothetical protein
MTTIRLKYSGEIRKILFPSLEMAQLCWDVLSKYYTMVGERPTQEDRP